jgi:hypothetical protein
MQYGMLVPEKLFPLLDDFPPGHAALFSSSSAIPPAIRLPYRCARVGCLESLEPQQSLVEDHVTQPMLG